MSNEEAAKPKVRADPHRAMLWLDATLERRPAQIGLASLLVLGLALLVGPSLFGRVMLTGRLKVGERAEGNIKAPRNFDYFPSEESVAKERAAAAAKVLPVFNHQSDVGAVLLARVGRAFSAMVAPDAGSSPGAPPVAESEALEEMRTRFANLLQAEVPAEVFLQLRKANFSADVRASLLSLVGLGMGNLIIGHRGALVPFQSRPVTVRHLVGGRGGQNSEELFNDLSRIKDLDGVRDELRVQGPVHVAKLTPALARVVAGLAQKLVVSNLTFDQEETESRRQAARESVQARPVTLVRGQIIIQDGEPITKEHLSIVRAMEAWHQSPDVVQVPAGLAICIAVCLVVVFRFAGRHFHRFATRPRDLVAMSALLLSLVTLARFAAAGAEGLGRGYDLPILLYLIPVAGGSMLVRLLISAEAAAMFSTVVAAMGGIAADQSLAMMLFYLVVGLVGAAGVKQVQSRSTILRAGLSAGAAGIMMVLGFRLLRAQLVSGDTVYSILAALFGGVLGSFVTLALLPAMEWLFAYTTDVTLLELANLNHPLLRELILRAPGTYHHSMVVGSLSETACDAIGANGLLARVACYYHDIGKMKTADYFAENFRPGENPHNRLKPSMSALIIRGHVKDTVELLREHHVPQLVIDTATQHHGQTLIEYFYHKATETKEPDEEIHEEEYRYPGPKPQTREAGVIMLADAVEAAARSLPEPTEDRLTAVVQRVINNKFTDGQLDHCDLTLRDLHLIAKSFLQVLRGIYHQRPSYPWQQTRRDETKRVGAEEGRRDSTRGKTTERLDAITDAEHGGKGKPARQGKPEKQEKSDRSEKIEKPEKSDKQEKHDKKGRPETRSDRKAKGPDRGAAEPRSPKEEAKGERDREREQRRTGPVQALVVEPPSQGESPPEVGPPGPESAPAEGSQDIKRLGL